MQRGATVIRADAQPLDAHDLRRLHAYSNSLVDFHMILDLIPPLAKSYFAGLIPATLSYGQVAILLGLGLQQTDVSAVENELHLPSNQILALFNKSVRRLYQQLKATKEAEIARTLPTPPHSLASGAVDDTQPVGPFVALEEDLDDELNAEAAATQRKMLAKLTAEQLAEFAIPGGAGEALVGAAGKRHLSTGLTVSVKGDKVDPEGKTLKKEKKDKMIYERKRGGGSSEGKKRRSMSNGSGGGGGSAKRGKR